MKAGKQPGADMMTEWVIRDINKERQLLAKPEPINAENWDEAIMTELGHTNDDITPLDLQPQLNTMDTDGHLDKQPNDTGLPIPAHPRPSQAQKTKAHNQKPQKTPHKDDTTTKKEECDTGIPTSQPENGRDGRFHLAHQTQRNREEAVRKPTGQRKKVRYLFLMPFIAVMALHLLLVPTTHMDGPILLLPMIRRVRRRYTLPLRYSHDNKQDHAPHNYRMWRPCMLLLYIACFFHTPTAPITGVPTCYHHAPVPSTTIISPHNTPFNNKCFLQCGDVHPNPGHRRIYQLRRDFRLVPGPPVPLLDIEEYAQHLVVNTNRPLGTYRAHKAPLPYSAGPVSSI